MADTAVETIGEIIANLGGTMTATTVVPALDELKDLLGEGGITDAVNAWLEDHPEATTTVQDNSLTTDKYQDGSITAVKFAEGVFGVLDADAIDALFEGSGA